MKENKKEIVIINKFKEDSENAEELLEKIFEMFCNMQSVQK